MPLPFIIKYKAGWHDITDEIEAVDPPWTLAKPDGVGALQFSTATYQRGPIPDPTSQVLLSMLQDFCEAHELGESADVVTEDGELRLAAASFRCGDDLIRVWHASDGRSFVKVTYTCAWGEQSAELPDCEQMIRTLRFSRETIED